MVDGKKYAFHLLPCGMLYLKCKNLIGNGVVVHIKTLMKELESLKEGGHTDAVKRLFISSRAHLLFDVHQTVDGLIEQEKAKGGNQIGTTKKGIGPCYSTKAARTGLRVADLLHWSEFETKYRALVADFQKRFTFDYDCEEELARHKVYLSELQSQIVDSVSFMAEAQRKGEKILVEGANAIMLDIDFGTYPYVTSSSTAVGGICTGLGVPPQAIKHTFGVVKAYTTRVGAGPFPTEQLNEEGEHLCSVGREVGTTTGRKRRCGWLDIPLVLYGQCINGHTAINLTKLDVLSGLKEIKICVAYKKKDGTSLPFGYFPAHLSELGEITPEYITLPGWTEDISKATSVEQLPANAKAYVKKVEELLGVPIQWVGVGPDRVNTIKTH